MALLQPSAQTPVAYSIPEAAVQLGVSRSQIYRLAADGLLTVKKVGGRSVVPTAELLRFLQEAPALVLSRQPR